MLISVCAASASWIACRAFGSVSGPWRGDVLAQYVLGRIAGLRFELFTDIYARSIGLRWVGNGKAFFSLVLRHDDMATVMATQPIDFVQFSYNILDREAEQRLLPMAADRGLAVIVNRPFRTKELFELFDRHPLPDFAGEIDCANWAQFFLKFVISHPGVTCAIPATSRVDHMAENMGAMSGRLPDAAMRARMIRYVESL